MTRSEDMPTPGRGGGREGRFTAHVALAGHLRAQNPHMDRGDASVLGALLIFLAQGETLVDLLLNGASLGHRRIMIEDALRLLASYEVTEPVLRAWIARARHELEELAPAELRRVRRRATRPRTT